jgi:four helix bundle protein
MSRDFRKLRVFQLADQLLFRVYSSSARFPATERYSLQAQLRSAALSAATDIVEGSARRSTREYLNFINIAAGSATEARYLSDVSRRLRYIPEREAQELIESYTELSAQLQALINSLNP